MVEAVAVARRTGPRRDRLDLCEELLPRPLVRRSGGRTAGRTTAAQAGQLRRAVEAADRRVRVGPLGRARVGEGPQRRRDERPRRRAGRRGVPARDGASAAPPDPQLAVGGVQLADLRLAGGPLPFGGGAEAVGVPPAGQPAVAGDDLVPGGAGRQAQHLVGVGRRVEAAGLESSTTSSGSSRRRGVVAVLRRGSGRARRARTDRSAASPTTRARARRGRRSRRVVALAEAQPAGLAASPAPADAQLGVGDVEPPDQVLAPLALVVGGAVGMPRPRQAPVGGGDPLPRCPAGHAEHARRDRRPPGEAASAAGEVVADGGRGSCGCGGSRARIGVDGLRAACGRRGRARRRARARRRRRPA